MTALMRDDKYLEYKYNVSDREAFSSRVCLELGIAEETQAKLNRLVERCGRANTADMVSDAVCRMMDGLNAKEPFGYMEYRGYVAGCPIQAGWQDCVSDDGISYRDMELIKCRGMEIETPYPETITDADLDTAIRRDLGGLFPDIRLSDGDDCSRRLYDISYADCTPIACRREQYDREGSWDKACIFLYLKSSFEIPGAFRAIRPSGKTDTANAAGFQKTFKYHRIEEVRPVLHW